MTRIKNICQTTDLVILGAGITGLSVNYYLHDQLSCVILEKSPQIGGVIQTSQEGDFLLEQGPDCFMNHKPWALDLALELGLQNELIESKDFQRRVFVFHAGQLEASDYENPAVTEFLGNRKKIAPKPVLNKEGVSISFKHGMQTLTNKLAAYSKNNILFNTHALHVDWQDKIITCNTGLTLKTQAILLALPALEAAQLLNIPIPFQTTQTASVYLAYPKDSIEHPLDAFGLILPAAENRKVSAFTFVSSKFEHRCPDHAVLFRAFLKGDFTDARTEIDSLFKPQSPPLLERGFRTIYADPRYSNDHREQLALLETKLPPGVFIAGSPYRGVGISDCIYQAKQTAQQNILKFCQPSEIRPPWEYFNAFGQC